MEGIPFILIDTGGIEPGTDDIILAQIREQAEIAIETAHVILFLVDGKRRPYLFGPGSQSILMRTGKSRARS